MILVAGALFVDPADRDGYLVGCRAVVEQARSTSGCLDFALSPDLVDPRRINVFERWVNEDELTRFRGSGPSDDQSRAIQSADVQEFHVDG
jgi:quinol monooxygenase YgiN